MKNITIENSVQHIKKCNEKIIIDGICKYLIVSVWSESECDTGKLTLKVDQSKIIYSMMKFI